MAETKRRETKKPKRVRKDAAKNTNSSGNRLIYGLFTVGALIFIISGIFYYNQVFSKPSNVFWDMINNNLATRGITRQVIQKDDSQVSNEIAQFNFGLPTAVRLTRVLTSNQSADNSTKIEGIGISDADYQRYVSVSRTSQDTESSFDKILGKWVQTGSSDKSKNLQEPNVLIRSLVGPVLSGNIPANQRKAIINEFMLNDVYNVQYDGVKKENENGKTVYKFPTTIKLKPFTTVMKKYATQLGISGADSIDPEQYQEEETIQAILIVGINSRQLLGVQYADSTIKESYNGYGVISNIEPPEEYLSYEDFQKLLGN